MRKAVLTVPLCVWLSVQGRAAQPTEGWILTPEHMLHWACVLLFKLAFPIFLAPNFGGGDMWTKTSDDKKLCYDANFQGSLISEAAGTWPAGLYWAPSSTT